MQPITVEYKSRKIKLDAAVRFLKNQLLIH